MLCFHPMDTGSRTNQTLEVARHKSTCSHFLLQVRHIRSRKLERIFFPLWSPDGKQISYLSGGGTARINSVEVRTQPSFDWGKPVSLPIQIYNPGGPGRGGRNYDILPNGNQFITPLPAADAQSGDLPSLQINTVLNWFSELKQKVPLK